jgi:hypothetical protein
MKINKLILFILFTLFISTVLIAQDEQNAPEGFTFIIGPRIGISYTFTTAEEYTKSVNKIYPGSDYVPFNTIFGINFEQRILLGQTNSHFAFQEVVTIHGLEQSIALPILALLIGYRDESGLEFGLGPIISFKGISVLGAVGYTISYRGVYIPLDITCTIPSKKTPISITFTTGFNFTTKEGKIKT